MRGHREWLSVLEVNGAKKASADGRFLARRFANYPNIIWMSGNDFQSWENQADNAVVSAVAKGIQNRVINHIQTIELKPDEYRRAKFKQ